MLDWALGWGGMIELRMREVVVVVVVVGGVMGVGGCVVVGVIVGDVCVVD